MSAGTVKRVTCSNISARCRSGFRARLRHYVRLGSLTTWRPEMKQLSWKEIREHVKWTVLPGLLILLPMVLLGAPNEPMPGPGGAFLFFLVASASGAALGFLQVFFESRGDPRALLLHR